MSRVLQTAISFLWAGLVLGLSFIETPLKFQAPGITEVLGVGIGRLVFTTLNRIEWVFAVMLCLALLAGRRDALRLWLYGAIAAIVLTQTFWLLPVLDARAQLLFDGHPAAPSYHHILFIAIEAAKWIALMAFGVVSARHG